MTNKAQITHPFADASPGEVFDAGKQALNQLGYAIVKDRSFAYLLQARKTEQTTTIDLNFIVNAFEKVVNLTLSSETADEDVLHAAGKQVIETLQEQL